MAYADGQSGTRGGVGQVNGLNRRSVRDQGWGWTGEWFTLMVSQLKYIGLCPQSKRHTVFHINFLLRIVTQRSIRRSQSQGEEMEV